MSLTPTPHPSLYSCAFCHVLPTKEQVYLPSHGLWVQPSDFLWPIEWIRSDGVLSIGLQRPHAFLLICSCSWDEYVPSSLLASGRQWERHGAELGQLLQPRWPIDLHGEAELPCQVQPRPAEPQPSLCVSHNKRLFQPLSSRLVC